MRRFIYILFLMAGFLTSSLGFGKSDALATLKVDSKIKKESATDDKLYFSDAAEHSFEYGQMMATHYSHYSHRSHYSHSSHRSHYSSYY